MQDKAVGELWSWVADDSVDVGLIPHAKVRALIRKLVEERVNGCRISHPDACLRKALDEFGIPEEGYNAG